MKFQPAKLEISAFSKLVKSSGRIADFDGGVGSGGVGSGGVGFGVGGKGTFVSPVGPAGGGSAIPGFSSVERSS